jgi:hypothetical protein
MGVFCILRGQGFKTSLAWVGEELKVVSPRVWHMAWLGTTAVVDQRLTSDDKLKYMKEDQAAKFRNAVAQSEAAAEVKKRNKNKKST